MSGNDTVNKSKIIDYHMKKISLEQNNLSSLGLICFGIF